MEQISIGSPQVDVAARWKDTLSRVREVLPLQNPLQSFLHNNLLMAFERYPFWEGVSKAAQLYNAHSTARLEFYASALKSDRIQSKDLCDAILRYWQKSKSWLPADAEIEHSVAVQIVAALMQLQGGTPIAGLLHLDAIGMLQSNITPPYAELIHFELGNDRRAQTQIPSDAVEWLCQLMEGMLDQGLSRTPNPLRNLDIVEAAAEWLSRTVVRPHTWQNTLCIKLRAFLDKPKGNSRSDDIVSRLNNEAIPDSEWADVILGLLFQMPGWSGLVNKSESDSNAMPFRTPNVTLEGLIILMFFLCEVFNIKLRRLAPLDSSVVHRKVSHTISVHRIRELLQQLQTMSSIPSTQDIIQAVEIMNTMDAAITNRVWHDAYEVSLYKQILTNVGSAASSTPHQPKQPKKRNSILCCMDDRNESFRRHIERFAPDLITYGVLGNFNLDMRYVSSGHPRPSQQCPPVVTPRRTIVEHSTVPRSARKQALIIQWWVDQQFFRSRGVFGGIIACIAIAVFALTYFPIRVISHRLAKIMRANFVKFMNPTIPSTPILERSEHPLYGPCGYDEEEQAKIVYSVLGAIGLINEDDFDEYVVCLAHQSTSANNPYRQAYGCGACSGNSGSINSRLFADMANNPRVRHIAREKGLHIPDKTLFVSAVQDTAMDAIEFHEDTEAYRHACKSPTFHKIMANLNQALEANAQERCRFFSNKPRLKSAADCLQHVQERSLNMAEPRPEYGHSRACLAIFGPRDFTKSLNLDRRSFLISYDPDVDKDHQHIKGLVHGAMPVVANITLDYFFSTIDPFRFGSGSKLPLNISALMGVISGSRGDIRIGLAAQMVEIHEPVRALVAVVQKPEIVKQIALSHRRLKTLLTNDWIRLIAIDPENGSMHGLIDCEWQPIDLAKRTNESASKRDGFDSNVFSNAFAFANGEAPL